MTALFATGGKFGDRQAKIERKGQAQSAAASTLDVTEDSTGRKSASNVPVYSKPGQTEVRLAPLQTTLGVLCGVSLVMLVRERLRLRGLEP